MNENLDRPDVSLPVPQLLEIDRICQQFEAAWNAGQKPSAEDFLGRMEEPGRSQLHKELAALEAEFRRSPAAVSTGKTRGGKRSPAAPSFEEFIRRLAESGLMTGQEVRQFLDSLTLEQRPTAADQLARIMFQKGLLTKFQAQAVFQGKTRGLVVGNYVVLDKLGAGGMGQVYKAQHRKMKRIVALKMLPSQATQSPDAVRRFQREVEAAAKLSHPNVVTAHDADEANGLHFLVMEHVDGQDLAALVKDRGPLPLAQAVDCTVQAARGLEYAHRQGVIHRDIKPSNLLLDKSGVVKVLDLGLARVEDAVGGADDGLTHSGQVMGTLDYMAPEQAFDTHHADVRSDIYSLGCTLHYLLTGRAPFAGETVTQKILAHREQAVPSLRAVRPDVPEWLDGAFQKMLAKRPEERQQTMGAAMAQLQQHALPQTGPAASVRPGPANVAETLSLQQGHVETSSEQVDAGVVSSPPPPGEGRGEGSSLPSPLGRGAEVKGIGNGVKMKLWSGVLHVLQQLSHRQKIAIATAVGIVFAFVLLGIVLTLQTKEGTLEIVTDDPDVQVAVKQNGEVVEVVDAKSGWTIRLKSGEYKLSPQGSTDKFRLEPNSVVVTHGDRAKAKVVTLKSPAISDSKSEISSFKSPLPPIGSLIGPDGKWKLPPGAPPPAVAPFDEKKAKEYQEAWAKYLGVPVEISNSIGMKLVLIPPGEFLMGSSKELIEEEMKRMDVGDWYRDELAGEGRRHVVRITRPFYFGVFDVTQEEFQQVMGYNPSHFCVHGDERETIAGRDTRRFPVENVTWQEANAFCSRLSEMAEEKSGGRRYRLPSEAQWEYGCRAGTTARWYFSPRSDENKAGESLLSDYAWFTDNAGGATHAVGERLASAWGLHDMFGNVWQWCHDWYDTEYYAKSPTDDPAGPPEGSHRAIRGGGYPALAKLCRSALRYYHDPGNRNGSLGFRVSLVLPDTAAERGKTESQSPKLQSQIPLPAIGSLIGPDGKWKLPPGAPPPAVAPFDEKKAKEYQEAWAKHLKVPVELTNSIGMKLLLIPPGEFTMGSPQELIDEELKTAPNDDKWYLERVASEGPRHHVQITRPFYLGMYPVTQEEYQRVMGANPSEFSATGKSKDKVAGRDTKRFPVDTVSWQDADEFCSRLSEMAEEKSAGWRYRLPSEAQWEYACRAGSSGRYFFSPASDEKKAAGKLLSEYAWFGDNSGDRPHAVGGRRASPWGLYDIYGNVFEWCQDWYAKDYYAKSPTADPAGSTGGWLRIHRGGGWGYPAWYCRSGGRFIDEPGCRHYVLGFRVSLVLPDKPGEPSQPPLAAPRGKDASTSKSESEVPASKPELSSHPPAIAPADAVKATKHQEN